jgi:pimeloyl-ACP methyl ester carboxylesterase
MNVIEWLRNTVGAGAIPELAVPVDQGTGPVVILVHGIASSHVTFDNLVPLLTEHHRVIAFDLLGHGDSPTPADATYTIEEHVQALAAAIRALKLREPFTLVGHSMGGLISTRYAATHPSGVDRLILAGPPIYPVPSAIGDARVRSRVTAYLRGYEFLRTNKTFTIRNAALLGRLLPIPNVLEISDRNWDAFVLSLENCIEKQTVITDLAEVRVHVDVVYGAFDAFIAQGGFAVVEKMRHVTMHRVEANDHLIRKRLARVVAQVIED